MPTPSEILYHSGDHYFAHLLTSIRSAKNSIHIEAHYFDSKKLGQQITRALLYALKKRVHVYLIVDGWSPLSVKEKTLFKILSRRGCKIRFFNPLPWKFFSFRHLFKMNKRSHKKVYVIDQTEAYLGSFNIDQRQLSLKSGGEGWRDIGLKVTGPALNTILKGFWDSWNYCQGSASRPTLQTLEDLASAQVRLNHKNFNRKAYFEDLISRIYNAKKSIWISNPYFVPDQRLCDALSVAARNGVEVKILLPQKSDLPFFPLINSFSYRNLMKSKVEIYEYKPSILHAKIFKVDDWTMIGSSNLNTRTQKHDWEIDYILNCPEAHKEITKRLVSDFNDSHRVTRRCIIRKFKKMDWAKPLLLVVKYWL